MIHAKKFTVLVILLSGMIYKPAQAINLSAPTLIKSVAAAIAGLTGSIALKTCKTYYNIRKIEKILDPKVTLRKHSTVLPICNWQSDSEGFRTAREIRENKNKVKDDFMAACTSGEITIFQNNHPELQQPLEKITFQNIISTIDQEIRYLDNLQNQLESFVGFNVNGLEIYGLHKNFAKYCDQLHITKSSWESHKLTKEQENNLIRKMEQQTSSSERLITFLFCNPHYDRAYTTYWKLIQKKDRLCALKEAISYKTFLKKVL